MGEAMSETDDLVSRARRHAETHPESRELIEELLEELLEAVVRWACFAAPSPVPSWPDGVSQDAANRLRWIANSGYIEDPGIKRIIRSWADELDATLVPPWPGAVLSGLTDEDGVPTWLALAPNVLGEDVRTCVDFPWFICGSDNAVTPYWVEVRAPRAVPEPETERVPVLDAIRDRIELTHPEGEFLAVGVELREDGDLVAIEQQEPWGKAQPVAPDGTVEVLRDGGR